MSEENNQEEENYENNEDIAEPKEEENGGAVDDELLDRNENHQKNPINDADNNENKQQFNSMNKHPKTNKENKNTKTIPEHQDENVDKNSNDDNSTMDDLFKKAMKKYNKNYKTIEINNEGNTMSTKITEVLYNKYVGQNIQKSKHLDIYSKIKDEEIRQGREATKTKQDAQKINNMIVRQEDYEKLKSNKKKGRQKEIKNKLHEECFNPNGKKNISPRTPNDFYIDQKRFIEKKEKVINKISQNILDKEAKNVNAAVLISKNSEKLANNKNPNESREDFCKRLAGEKLKNIKAVLEAPREEKKMTKQELKDLTDKLYKESETFKNNRIKMKQEQINKIKKLEKNDFVLQKSKKVLFDKFMSIYENTLNELFEKKDNFQIDYDEYVAILNHLEFIKPNNSNSNNDNLVKESFNTLKPQEDKIDTYSFLIFALAALGIYKGNDEKVEEHSSKVTIIKGKKAEDIQKLGKDMHIGNKNANKKNPIKTSSELIKAYLPDLDLEKYGFTGKVCKMIKTKYLPFVSGISESWAKDLFKRKYERQEENKKNNLEETKKLEKKSKKEGGIIDSFRQKVLKDEFFQQDNNNNNDTNNEKGVSNNTNNNLIKSFKVEDMYEILQKKKQRELDTLKAKQEEDILQECTFQPNSKTRPVNKKEVAKNIEKLYIEGKNSYLRKKQQGDKDPDLNSENEKNCTFKPVIKDYKGKYFENNPLKDDKYYNMEIKKKERKREEINRGLVKHMSFGIEPKSNKDDIYKRVIPNRTEKSENVENDFIEYTYLDEDDNQTMMKIEINLDNNKKELMIIYPEDDFIQEVNDFCKKHKLNEEKKNKIIGVIREKMEKNK